MRLRTLIIGGLCATTLGVVAVAATSEQLNRLNLVETQLSADTARNRHQLAQLLSVLEMLKRDPPPALLVSPEDARDAVRAAILVRAMTPQLQERAQDISRDATEVMRQRRLAAVQSEALFEQESLAAESLPEPDSGGMPRSTSGPLVLHPPTNLLAPTTGAILKRFGDDIPGGGEANGITYQPAPASKVISPDGGVVQYVGPVKGWGVIIILRLAGGYHLVLAGLERPSVQSGQSVAAGQAVGFMPDGRQSAIELYLELREQGTPVNPARWMNKTTG
jgi:septal ring factor EnvC (AmiA/AmiB activator)